MTGVDTNILVRFFAKDDLQQSPQAKALLGTFSTENPGWVGVATILELVWVMSSQFRVGRDGVAAMLDQLLSREEIVIEQYETILRANRLFKAGRADFADCLIASSAKAAGCDRTLTFDRIAARDAGMQLIA